MPPPTRCADGHATSTGGINIRCANRAVVPTPLRRLYGQALACRMRPFGDGVLRYPRLVRDLGRSLGKEVRLEIIGAKTQVDRDILEKLDAPLGHLLRNALDHGIELPEERGAAGKPSEGVIRLEAHHSAGALQIAISDDGRGIDVEKLRQTVTKRRHVSAEKAEQLSESELLEFLFLPGFSMKDQVTEISGRGVGLDVVRDIGRAENRKSVLAEVPDTIAMA